MAVRVELKYGTPHGGGVDGANANTIAGRPTAILFLDALQMLEHGRAVLVPDIPVLETARAVTEHGLGVVIVGELIATKSHVAAKRNLVLAILEPLLAQFIVS
jgi:hypothetical protein